MNILVCDDDREIARAIGIYLSNEGYTILTAYNGREALKLLETEDIHLIIMDIMMPGMDGVDTLRAIRRMPEKWTSDVPCLVLTADAHEGAKQMLLNAGFDDYLSKPIDSEKLENTIMEFLPPEKVIIDSDNYDSIPKDESDFPWINGLSIIDSSEGIKNCGNADSYLSIIKVYYQSISTNRNNILNALENENYKDYTSYVHSLKSTSRTIGAVELSAFAKDMEDAGNRNDFDLIKSATPRLMEMYASIEKELDSIPEISEDTLDGRGEKPKIENDMLIDAFNSILETTISMDYDTLSFILKSINEYSLMPDDNAIIKKIEKMAYRLDWDGIKTLITERINKEK